MFAVIGYGFLGIYCPATGDPVKLRGSGIAEINREGRMRRLPGGGGKQGDCKAVTNLLLYQD
ncbi:MAG: hypothetical protein AB1546_05860 [bacterium]